MAVRGGANQGSLLKDLQAQVRELEKDLRERGEAVDEYRDKLDAEYQQARKANRTAATYGAWLDERVTQVAAAWVLACVFVRFCEDNGLIADVWIAGRGERLREAEEHHEAYFRRHPDKNDRDWLVAAFEHLASTNPTVAGLFDRTHNPLWELAPSYEAASALLKFWRRVDADGEIVHHFEDAELETRFLGDLYQDLSAHARKTYALLQTPVFVEEFILDLTLEPAVEEFGLSPVVTIDQGVKGKKELPAGLRTIDPACGSGHFLLGLFARLLAKWREQAPGEADWTLIRRALGSVHGCDKNPFAAAIARFRLMVAVLKEAGVRRLAAAPEFPINVAVGDSLLHGRGAAGILDDLFSSQQFFYRTEDVQEFVERSDLLGRGSYHVVVGNPPYITVKDKAEKKNYLDSYEACSGAFALSVPFAQRIFELAVRVHGSHRSAGYTGQITANSFMKREFGKRLISWLHQEVDLTHVIDTSGAYIPGHGTPTVILAGRNRTALQSDGIQSLLGIRGEPTQAQDASTGFVWTAIVDQIHRPGSESEWISSVVSERSRWRDHPWSLGGGGANELFSALGRANEQTLSETVSLIGRTAHTGSDESYFADLGSWPRRGVGEARVVSLVEGTVIRDWDLKPETEAIFPYSDSLSADLSDSASARHLWIHRCLLRDRREPAGTHEEIGLTWYEWSRWHPERFRVPLGLAFAFVATHNHFVLDRGGKVFKQSAPVIKLPEGATEDQHLQLLGLLNSSTACFWLKQVSHAKTGAENTSGGGNRWSPEPWYSFYEFTGTKLKEFPLPADLPLAHSRALDSLARRLAAQEPSAACAGASAPNRSLLDESHVAWDAIRGQMVALQEELDWKVYHSYGLLADLECGRLVSSELDSLPEVRFGERAFEILLARQMAAGEVESAWFRHHGFTPTTEIPTRWPAWYRDIVQARIDTITSRRDLALIERPECKRRWATDPWDKREKAALRTWLLDRCEDRDLWFHLRDDFEQPRTLTIGQLADLLSRRPDAADITTVAGLYATHLGKPNLSLEHVLTDVIDAEHVPYLAAYRYKDSGLRKRAQWEDVWELQREEDRTNTRLDIPVPPKYTGADFAKQSYWSNRGKLDVPKERFISYPDANPDADPTLLLGWAGWDHRDQVQALLNIVNDRIEQADWETPRLVPLLAGIVEQMPWVKQWFGTEDEDWGGNAAEEYQASLDDLMSKRQLTAADLAAWRPAPKSRARKAK